MGGTEGNWGSGITGLAATCEGLVLIFVFLRVYTRVWIARAFWWDDFTIILALLGTTIGCALCFVNVRYGFGKHIQFISEHDLREFRKYTFGEWIQTFATLMWTKISICLFLIRIPNNHNLRYAMYWCVAFLLFSNTILTTMWIMSCQPVHTQWYGQGICMSRFEKEAIIMTQAVISIVSDFLFAAFPIFYFWRLQVDLKTKVGLWLLMCLGVITGACCIVRTVLNGQSIPFDETYDGIVNWTWRLFEVQFGIIAACVPTLRPLYSAMAAWYRGDSPPMGDGNIKFLHSEKEQSHRWVDKGKHDKPNDHENQDKANGSTGERPRKHTIRLPGKEPKHAEDMRQDLVNEGIIKSDAHKGVAGRDRDVERGTSSAGLATDMHKYGIPDEFSSRSTTQPGTAEQTPKMKGEEWLGVDEHADSDQPAHPKPDLHNQPAAYPMGPRNAPPAWEGAKPHFEGNGSVGGAEREGQLEWDGMMTEGRDGNPKVGNDDTPGEAFGAGSWDGHMVGACDTESISGDSSGSGGSRKKSSLQEALDEDEGLGPMQTAREWEPGTAF